jgi:uncharacterized protein (TIGR03437 family)
MRVPVTYRLTISLIVVLIFSTLALGTASDRIRTAGAASLPGIVQRIAAQNLPLLRSAIGRNLLPAQAPTCEMPLFEKVSQISASGYPQVVTGDFNSDGKTDVALPEMATSRVRLYFGNGDGTLRDGGGFKTGAGWNFAPHLVTGDFTGDQFTDLLVIGTPDGNRIWLNDGKGGFNAGLRLTGNYSYFPVVADFNHDGKQDLASDNFLLSGFQIHLSDSQGNLSVLPAIYSLPGVYRMTTADFNGDGELDIAGTTSEADRVRIFFGNGKGQFTTGQPAAAGLASILPDFSLAIQAADINRDGKADLLTDGIGLTVMFNQGNGTFQPRTFPDFYALYGTGDFDGDGLPDALGNEHLALNNGDGTFCIKALPEPISRVSATTAEFNNDGRTDIITQSPVDSISIFLSRGQINIPNTPPVITDAFAEIRQQVRDTEIVIATISDAETPAGLLFVTAPSLVENLSHGINSIYDLKNTDGRVSLRLGTYCIGQAGAVNKIRLRVTDAAGLSTESEVTVRVLPHEIPTITAPETLTVDSGKEVTFEAQVGDDQTSIKPQLLFPQIPGFAGDITEVTTSADPPGFRRFRISNASPVGTYLINLTAQICNLSATRQIRLTVNGNIIGAAPKITTIGNVSVQQGQTTEEMIIAQVSDTETPADELKVDASSRSGDADGISFLNIRNNNGVITARINVRCEDVGQTNRFQLRVTDSDGNFAVSDLIVNTTLPPAIIVPAYPGEVTYTGEPLRVSPLTPGSNFNRASIGVAPPGLKVAADVSGVLTLEGSIPSGNYLVTVYFSNPCLSSQASFTVRVPVPPPAINCQSLRFTRRQDYPSTGTPYSVTTGDFNRDGMMDIASTNTAESNVSILLAKTENGVRTFESAGAIATGQEPRFIATGDFNRDGYADLTTANYQGSSLSIIDGRGEGTFLGPNSRHIPVAGNPLSVNVADFNRDGNQDLLAVTDTGAKVVLLLGDGAGNFAQPIYFNAGNLPQPPELVDFDSDGRMDLFVPDYTGNRIGLMRGLGNDVGFSSPVFRDVGFNITAVVAADFNVDGVKDIAALDSDHNSVAVFLSVQGRPFENQVTLSAGLYPASLVASDFNADGLMDLAVSNYSESTIAVFLGDGKGGFTASPDHLLEIGSHPLSLISVDLNNDKLPDLITANSGADTISVIYSGCSGAASGAAQPEITVTSAASYFTERLAQETIATVFGSEFTSEIRAASLPLPMTLGGVTVAITDSENKTHPAPLFFVSPTQINYQIPASVAVGPATISVRQAGGRTLQRRLIVTPIAPGLFTADGSGRGFAAAFVIRVRPDGSQSIEPIMKFDATANSVIAAPVDAGSEGDELYLALFGTGIRHRRSLEKVSARIGELSVPVVYAGAQNSFAGLDQVNLKLPRNSALSGEQEIEVRVEGFVSNKVKVRFR